MNISQLRDTINAAYRAVWYFRRSQDFYGIRWAHEALARTRGIIESFAPVPQVALDNAALVVESSLKAADIVLTTDYLEAGLIPPLLELQAEAIAAEGLPKPEKLRFEQNLSALLREENGAAIAEEVFGKDFAQAMQKEILKTRYISGEQWQEVLRLLGVLRQNDYAAEYTATGDITLKPDGYYLHTNNAPLIEGLNWATRNGAASYRVFGAGLLYHIRGLQELYPGLSVELYETNPAILTYALVYAPFSEVLSEGHIRMTLLDESEDEEQIRQLFPEEDNTDAKLILRTHAASVNTLRNKELREYLLRFGDRNGLTEGSSPKRVSVIIPCYNVESYLDRCLLSVIKQTIGIDQLEVICVDDASTDKTLDKLQEWARRYPVSFKVIPCAENGRQGRARNIGLQYATADYVTFIDADDWIEAQMLEEMYTVATETGVEVVAGTHGVDSGDGVLQNIEAYDGPLFTAVRIETEQDRLALLQHGLHSNVWGKLYRREVFSNYNLYFPEKLAYEDNFFGPLLKHMIHSYYVTDAAYYHWFLNENSTGSGRNLAHHFDRLTVEEMKQEALEERGLITDATGETVMRDFVQKYFLNSLYIFFVKFDALPYEQIKHMCETLPKYYPDLRETDYYHSLSDTNRTLVNLAFDNAPEAVWQDIGRQYKEAVLK